MPKTSSTAFWGYRSPGRRANIWVWIETERVDSRKLRRSRNVVARAEKALACSAKASLRNRWYHEERVHGAGGKRRLTVVGEIDNVVVYFLG